MVDLLVQEEIKLDGDQTGACMEYLLKHDVLGALVNISEADYPPGIRGETIRTLATLINLLDVKFLIHTSVHIPTLKLLRLCIREDQAGEKHNFYIDDLIDLLYTLCSKIHALPQLLNIFFYDRRWLTTPHKSKLRRPSPKPPHLETPGVGRHELQITNKMFDPEGDEVVPTITAVQDQPDYECLLFSYLLKYIHRDGKSGDYARTGLLFLLEVAGGGFRDYILNQSDLCQILGAGLGALYSQLPRKLLVRADVPADTVTHRVEAEDDLTECEVTSSPAFRALMDGRAICVALLSAIRVVFLETILYPSMLESSDTDGSAVAVLSYIDITLQTLQDGELLDCFARYLISCDEEELLPLGSDTSSVYSSTSSHADRRYRRPSLLAFNLKDLLLNNLQSAFPAAVVASLKLLTTVLTHHPKYSLPLLAHSAHFIVSPRSLPPAPAFTTMASHDHETQAYFLLINNLDPRFNADGRIPGYEPYLRAAEAAYHAHRSFTVMRQEQAKNKAHVRKHTMDHMKGILASAPLVLDSSLDQPQPTQHYLPRDDPLLVVLLQLLDRFFSNPCELNLFLTHTLSALVTCPLVALDEWIAFKLRLSVSYTSASPRTTRPADPDASDDDMDLAYAALFRALTLFNSHVCQRRNVTPVLDALLEERRQSLMLNDVDPRTSAFIGAPINSDCPPSHLEASTLPQEAPSDPSQWISLGFLDNILILEEAIKELIAIIHVRRGQGLDEDRLQNAK
ncbi:hypothetical protein L0F63_006344, partial [Massospora cicadina]